MKDKENRHWCSNDCDCQLKIKKLPFYTGLSEGMEMEISKYIAQSIKEEREKTIEEILEIGDEIDGENNSNTWRKIFNKLITLK